MLHHACDFSLSTTLFLRFNASPALTERAGDYSHCVRRFVRCFSFLMNNRYRTYSKLTGFPVHFSPHGEKQSLDLMNILLWDVSYDSVHADAAAGAEQDIFFHAQRHTRVSCKHRTPRSGLSGCQECVSFQAAREYPYVARLRYAPCKENGLVSGDLIFCAYELRNSSLLSFRVSGRGLPAV